MLTGNGIKRLSLFWYKTFFEIFVYTEMIFLRCKKKTWAKFNNHLFKKKNPEYQDQKRTFSDKENLQTIPN